MLFIYTRGKFVAVLFREHWQCKLLSNVNDGDGPIFQDKAYRLSRKDPIFHFHVKNERIVHNAMILLFGSTVYHVHHQAGCALNFQCTRWKLDCYNSILLKPFLCSFKVGEIKFSRNASVYIFTFRLDWEKCIGEVELIGRPATCGETLWFS